MKKRLWHILPIILAITLMFSCWAAISSFAADTAFENRLNAENFPESYRPALRKLHETYPNWVFRAQHTGLSWDTVLTAESKVGTSLVPASSIASWKSCEKGAYNPSNGTWYGLDGASWVAASKEIIAYYLDPRNALTATSIFQFENLAYSSACTADGVKAILASTFMAGDTYAKMFMDAGKNAGVSPYHLASRARQEQGKSGNDLAHGTVKGYEGYYNFFNIGAWATSTLSAVQNGAKYAAGTNSTYYLPWTSPEKSIKGGAVYLGSSYINREQNTLYLQKFDVTDGQNGYYSHQYMTNILAPTSEASTLCTAYPDAVKAGAMEFCIPVYENMPATACAKPTSSGNNNNLLSALAVSGQALTPTFSMYTATYDLVVSSSVSSATVTATASDKGASVSGVGAVSLQSGNNAVAVTVTAPSGVRRTYTVNIYRKPSTPGGDTPAVTVKSTAYRVGGDIRGVKPGTNAAAFLKTFSADNSATLSLVSESGTPVSGTVGTGNCLQVIVGNTLCASYPVVIRGDTSGDGVINSLDLLKIQKRILGVTTLSAPAGAAADANGDNAINALDLLRTQKHILGLVTIEQ